MRRILAFVIGIWIAGATVFCVAAEDITVFRVGYISEEESITVIVQTDRPTGVGGLDVQINYNTEMWELNEESIKSNLKAYQAVTKDGKIRGLWDALAGEELPEVLISVSFRKIAENANTGDIVFAVNQYYDNTVQMNDLPYEIRYELGADIEPSDDKAKPGSIVWVVVPAVITVAGVAVGCYYFCQKRKGMNRKQ